MQIHLFNLTKIYEGGVVGAQDVNYAIEEGVLGLVGPNGAGKTTVMRILSTLLEPTRGTAVVDGYDVRYDKPEIRRILGYLPQDFGLYPSLTCWEMLDYVGLLSNMTSRRQRHEAIEQALAQVRLEEVRHRKVGTLSGGMRRRLGIAQAILHHPRFLIFDEPTAGLDPEERIRIRNLLAELGGDRIIILSTHIVADVASAATKLAVMNQGRIIYSGTPADLTRRAEGKVWRVPVSEEEMPLLRQRYPVTEVLRSPEGIFLRVVAETVDHPAAMPTEATLEDAYVWLMGGKVDAGD
jgi:ABC-type multidrug transport system ATPase subunit